VKRREFIRLLGSAATWPLAARAQQPAMPEVGFLHARSPDDTALQVAALRRGLAEIGYIEGQSVTIEYRFALGQYDRLPMMGEELARRPVAVLVAGSDPAALAAKAATTTIPIAFAVCRSGQAGARGKLQSTRRQRHRHEYSDLDARSQAARAVA
jgi:putative tryptophan/tyrosine transport system substrate-binding protein